MLTYSLKHKKGVMNHETPYKLYDTFPKRSIVASIDNILSWMIKMPSYDESNQLDNDF